jgi:hypothetical protein
MNTQRLTSAYKDLNHGGEDIQRLARSHWQQYARASRQITAGQTRINQTRKAEIAGMIRMTIRAFKSGCRLSSFNSES